MHTADSPNCITNITFFWFLFYFKIVIHDSQNIYQRSSYFYYLTFNGRVKGRVCLSTIYTICWWRFYTSRKSKTKRKIVVFGPSIFWGDKRSKINAEDIYCWLCTPLHTSLPCDILLPLVVMRESFFFLSFD